MIKVSPTFLKLLLLAALALPASAVPVLFPGATTTYNGAFGGSAFFLTGNNVTETVTVGGLPSVSSAVFDFTIINSLAPTALINFDVLINSVLIGNFVVNPGDTTFNLPFSFAPIAAIGSNYTLTFLETNDVFPGGGSILFNQDGVARLNEMASSVPEIDAASSAIPLGILLFLGLLVSDRRQHLEVHTVESLA